MGGRLVALLTVAVGVAVGQECYHSGGRHAVGAEWNFPPTGDADFIMRCELSGRILITRVVACLTRSGHRVDVGSTSSPSYRLLLSARRLVSAAGRSRVEGGTEFSCEESGPGRYRLSTRTVSAAAAAASRDPPRAGEPYCPDLRPVPLPAKLGEERTVEWWQRAAGGGAAARSGRCPAATSSSAARSPAPAPSPAPSPASRTPAPASGFAAPPPSPAAVKLRVEACCSPMRRA